MASAQVKIESPHPDFDLKITRCAYSSGTVVIDMLVTNFGADDELRLNYGDVFAFDDEGNSYDGSNMKILCGVPNKALASGWSAQDQKIPQDIPLKYRVQLEGISANASKFSLLSIGFFSNSALSLKSEKPVKIRNLEWAK
ncbi:MAG: hypothetical protein SNG35_05840 [Rikenellaceae bacterium]